LTAVTIASTSTISGLLSIQSQTLILHYREVRESWSEIRLWGDAALFTGCFTRLTLFVSTEEEIPARYERTVSASATHSRGHFLGLASINATVCGSSSECRSGHGQIHCKQLQLTLGFASSFPSIQQYICIKDISSPDSGIKGNSVGPSPYHFQQIWTLFPSFWGVWFSSSSWSEWPLSSIYLLDQILPPHLETWWMATWSLFSTSASPHWAANPSIHPEGSNSSYVSSTIFFRDSDGGLGLLSLDHDQHLRRQLYTPKWNWRFCLRQAWQWNPLRPDGVKLVLPHTLGIKELYLYLCNEFFFLHYLFLWFEFAPLLVLCSVD